MTTKRLDGWSGGTAPAPAPASARGPILIELILEIVARSDVTSVIRFAGTSKFIRRAILGPAFRRRLALHGRFDPACLVAVSFMRHDVYRSDPAHRIFHTPSPTQHLVRMDTSSLSRSFKPVASRDGLLLLHQERFPSSNPELLVCNTFTGRITPLPPAAVRDTCLHVFLSAREGHGGLSYEYQLLVLGRDLRFQTFSSKHRKWGAVRKASTPRSLKIPGASSGSAAVIGRAVYWLCTLDASEVFFSYKIVALDMEAEVATTMDLPSGCLSALDWIFNFDHHQSERRRTCCQEHLLLASVRGRLSLLVAEECGISMWTLAAPATSTERTAVWSQELVVGREEIEKQVPLVGSDLPFVLEGFGERSGAVIVRVGRGDLLRLDLGTKVVSRLHYLGHASVTSLFLHETALVSFLQGMRSF